MPVCSKYLIINMIKVYIQFTLFTHKIKYPSSVKCLISTGYKLSRKKQAPCTGPVPVIIRPAQYLLDLS